MEPKMDHSAVAEDLDADSTLGDPCVTHTVLDQPWRSSVCLETRCSGRWMDDGNLKEGWYRFSSYDNVKIPESAVPFQRCSGWRPGWLNGLHPSVGDGEVTRTVCFTWIKDNSNGDTCLKHQEITIKNCDGYFVYLLKPTAGDYSVYCADSTRSDPCVIHTVLDQPWRSTDCSNTQCINGQWRSDENLAKGWYRFNSSGGWKIPETAVPAHHCSGKRPRWLNAADSALGDPCVNHTVLDQPWRSTGCTNTECTSGDWKNDDNHRVGWYRFKSSSGRKIPETVVPTHHCSGTSPGWLNDPASVPTEEPQETTPEPREDLSTVPEPDTSSDPPSGTTQEPQGATSGDSSQGLTSDPAGSASSSISDPKISTGEQTQGSSTGESTQEPSSVPVGDTSSGPQSAGGEEHKESTTRDHSGTPSAAPEGETCSVT
ncbi:uncharacterized protein LOC144591025 isoform X2 [Rhinoraja longicauda]